MSEKYDDIIHLPHHVSPKRNPLTAMERAAQFSPFSALTGLGAKMSETARLTNQRMELDEYAKASLDALLRELVESKEKQEVLITYFVPDERKEGGSYQICSSTVKKLDLYLGLLLMEDGTKIPIEEIYEIEKQSF